MSTPSSPRALGRGLASLIAVPDREETAPSLPPSPSPPLVTAPSASSDRTRRRRTLELASRRPATGTSELLSYPMSQEITGHVGKGIVTYDLVRLAPIHLVGGEIDREIKKRGKKGGSR